MKIDFHCHTCEGSSDSKVSIKKYIELLKNYGFDGMLVTDHNSYDGYDYYLKHKSSMPNDFAVFKGIEYDTYDAGHFVVIMPDDVEVEVLRYRGLKALDLVKIVHENSGIIGPAHPCGEPFLSAFSTGKFKVGKPLFDKLINEVDFLEGFNCGEDEGANSKAVELAQRYNKPVLAGSDSHWERCIGLSSTTIFEEVRNNDELIKYIKKKKKTVIEGKPYDGTIKARLGKWNKLLVYGFFFYNKFGALINLAKRNSALKRYKYGKI